MPINLMQSKRKKKRKEILEELATLMARRQTLSVSYTITYKRHLYDIHNNTDLILFKNIQEILYIVT